MGGAQSRPPPNASAVKRIAARVSPRGRRFTLGAQPRGAQPATRPLDYREAVRPTLHRCAFVLALLRFPFALVQGAGN